MALIKKPIPGQDRHAEIQACLRKGDYKGALAAFEALLKTGSGQGQMRMRYADTLVLAGRKNDAIREYLRVAEEMAEGGYLVQAVAIYKKIVKLDPRQTGVFEKLARLDAERTQASAAARPASIQVPVPAAADDDGGFELDIGAGMGLGPAPASPAAVPVSAPAAAVAAPKPRPAAPVAPIAAAAPAASRAAAPASAPTARAASPIVAAPRPAPAAVARPTPAPVHIEPEIAPDLDLSPDDIGNDFAADAGVAGGLEPPELTPAPVAGHGGFGFGMPAPAPAPAASAKAPSGGGFDFGLPAAAPAPAASAPAPAGGGFDFGLPAAAPAPAASAPAPAGDGLDFELGAPDDSAPMLESGPDSPFLAGADRGGGAAGFGSGAAGEDDNLLGLGSDDIDAMLDGIIRDVGSDEAGGVAALETADSHIPLFSHLAVDEYVEVLKLLSWRIVKQGDVIVHQGAPGNSLFIISSGKVEATIDRGGKQQTIATMQDGDFFGEIAVLSGGPRTATVTALTGTELLELERDKLQEVFSRFPGIEAKLRLAHEERVMRSSEQR